MTSSSSQMPDFQQLMQQAQKMQEELLQSQAHLAHKTVETSVGGGMVTVWFSGDRQLQKIAIDPQVIDPKDPNLLQDFIVAAVNQGLQKVKQLEEAEMQKTVASLGLPPTLL